ncbi:MAG: tetratricopeptide repeat protein [Epsilonproteobacteria bacterium]|nr:tetratricopeptide repeat protein [Campylobacterota bacterium]
MQRNKTYAKILEQQGFFDEAYQIYKELLQVSPNDTQIKQALRRLKKLRTKFIGVNEKQRDFFVQMQTDEEFREFEEWLIGE